MRLPSIVTDDVPATRCDRLAQLFKAFPQVWLDSRQLASVGGFCAWRTRVADLRRPPYNLTIENRVRRLASGVRVSEYRYAVVEGQ